MYITESFCCTPETSTKQYINCTPKKKKKKDMSKDFKESKRLPEIYLITVKQGDVWVKKGKELYILTLNRVTITQKATANIPKSCSTESH